MPLCPLTCRDQLSDTSVKSFFLQLLIHQWTSGYRKLDSAFELCGLPYMWRSISYSFILNPQYMNRFQFCIYLVWYFGIQYLSEIYKIHNSSSGKDDNVCSTLIDCKSQILLQLACYRTKLQILFNILSWQ